MCPESHNPLVAKLGVEPLSPTNHCSVPSKALCAPLHLNAPAAPTTDWGLARVRSTSRSPGVPPVHRLEPSTPWVLTTCLLAE